MELKPGYKRTEVGVIPEDWNAGAILEISSEIMDYRGRTPRKLGLTWGGGDIPALSAGNVKNGYVDFSEECYFGSEELYKRWMVKGDVAEGDIVFTTEAPLGNVALIPDDRRYILSQRTILLRTNPEVVESRFLYHAIKSDVFQRILLDNASGSTAKGIQRKRFEKLSVCVPPLKEQEHIATALSDVDALISSLDQLIAKKRDFKQATMQQLLTGKERLPGFSGGWRQKTFGDIISHCFSGATPSRANPEFYKGDIRWITSGELNYNVINDTAEKISQEAVLRTNLKIVPKDTFLMAITGLEAEGTRGSCGIVGQESTTNQSCMAIFPTADLLVEYLFHYYVFRGKSLALQYCQGTKQQSYTAKIVKLLPILLPSVEEQRAIAIVLSDMDTELAALEEKRDKTRALKQGMMQELLTGRIRLV
ncbi:restriction endonuclease subunit S [Cupriavidus sp. 2TAF22]|uniref:restriction endonuclease subunit S n=1 Tax=Cupriavidus sp. 2TAF22 TaxID=3233010 RepID=UPI003F92C4D4